MSSKSKRIICQAKLFPCERIKALFPLGPVNCFGKSSFGFPNFVDNQRQANRTGNLLTSGQTKFHLLFEQPTQNSSQKDKPTFLLLVWLLKTKHWHKAIVVNRNRNNSFVLIDTSFFLFFNRILVLQAYISSLFR